MFKRFSSPQPRDRSWIYVVQAMSFAAILTSCAGRHEETTTYQAPMQTGTLADLETINYDVKQQNLDDVDAEAALESYKNAVQLFSSDPTRRAESLRRMADLAMVSAEKETGEAGLTGPDHDISLKEEPVNLLEEAESELDRDIDKMLYESFMAGATDAQDKEEIYTLLDMAGNIVPELEGAELQANYETAIKLYQSLLQNTDDPGERAEALYLLAKAYDLAARKDESIETLNQLAKSYPNSQYYVEAQFRRGENLFVNSEYLFAAEAYKEVLKAGPDTDFYLQGQYKHGWAQYKLADFEVSVSNFFELADGLYNVVKGGSASATHEKLLRDSYRAASLCFNNMDGPRSVTEYFASNGNRPYESEIYQALGDIYVKQERFRDAALAYNEFINVYPGHPLAPKFSTWIIEAYTLGGFPSLVIPAKEDYIKRYGIHSDYWKNNPQEVRDEYLPLLVGHLKDMSKYYHAEAQEQGVPESYGKAIDYYREFLATAPEDEDAAEYNHLLAEALYASDRYQEAIVEFDKTAYDYHNYVKAADAAYFGLIAHQAYKQSFNGTEDEVRDLLDKKIAASVKFSKTFPEHEKAALVLHNIIEDQLALKDIKAAVQTASILVKLDPPAEEKLQLHAWQTIANGEYDLERFSVAEYAYNKVLGYTDISKKDRELYAERLAASVYKQAERFEKDGFLEEAAKGFLRVAEVNPDAEVREAADFDAATIFLKLEKWNDAIATLEDFRKNFPESEHVETIPDKLAMAYENIGNFTGAAQEMVKIATRYEKTDKELARQALWQAAEMQDRAENAEESIALYKDYVWKYEEPFDQRAEGQYRIVKLYQKIDNQENVKFWQNQLIQNWANAGAAASPRVTYLAAYARFELAQPLQVAFDEIKIKLPLKKSMTRKKAAMDKARDEYTSIAKMGVAEYATASNHKIAELYQTLARDLMDMERPKGLDMLELEMFEITLEEQALPFEDTAIDLYISNTDLVTQNIYDKWVKASFARLAELLPGRYAKYEQSEDYVDIIY